MYYSVNELYHHGILGMKWGVRRYQNEDGSLTEAGKRKYRYKNPDGTLTEEGRARRNKKIRNAVIGTAAIAGLVVLAKSGKKPSTNGVAKATEIINDSKTVPYSEFCKRRGIQVAKEITKEVPKKIEPSKIQKLGSLGKTAIKNFGSGAADGLTNGSKDAGKKVVTTMVTGLSLLGAKEISDMVLGRNTSDKVFKANNSKNIDKFWKDGPDANQNNNRNDEDDDDDEKKRN